MLALANSAPAAGTTSASAFVLAPPVVEAVHIEEHQVNEYVLFVKLCEHARQRFASLTEARVGRTLTLALEDGTVLMNPVVQAPIPSGVIVLEPVASRGKADALASKILDAETSCRADTSR